MNLLILLGHIIAIIALSYTVYVCGRDLYKAAEDHYTQKCKKKAKEESKNFKIMSAIFETKRSVKQLLDQKTSTIETPQFASDIDTQLKDLDAKITALTEGLIKLVDRIDIKK